MIVRLGKSVGAVGLAGGQVALLSHACKHDPNGDGGVTDFIQVMDLKCEAKADVTVEELTWIQE